MAADDAFDVSGSTEAERAAGLAADMLRNSAEMNATVGLRVLHVLEATLGGTRRYLDDLAVALAAVPIEQGLVYGTSRADSGFGDLLAKLERSDWFLAAAPVMRRPVSPADDLAAVAIVRRAIRQFRPTIVHAHSAKGGAIGRLAALTLGRAAPPVVYSPHALPSRLGAGYMIAERALARATRRFIAVSDSERSQIVSEGICSAARVDVVYPRIDAQYFAPRDGRAARDALALAVGPIVIGIGRLAPQKDPLQFVKTIAKVRERYPETVGIWVGDGELREATQTAAGALGLGDNFRIAGWTNDVRPYIAACDVLLSTSRYESFGYVIPETFAMERAVVAARVMGVVDVLDVGREEMLFEPGRSDDAALLIGRMIGDGGLRTALARAGRQSVIERFSTAAMSAALRASYDRAVR